ncbi:alkaline phosphatase family protein [Actinoplanes sp. NPDC051633]|uniref:alkaline phosphatase family protein n=1 Tax=Actinoplanes sp. NPDC051633 TaxID=3155670 RepID=UPI00341683C4
MKPLLVLDVVGLTPRLLEHMPRLNGIAANGFQAELGTVLPAVTCSAQSTFLTGELPSVHGIVGNGWYFRDLGEVFLWRQHNGLVGGEKIWQTARRVRPELTVANVCWWYAMGADVNWTVTPRPIYHADGRKDPDCYTRPPALRDELTTALGTFPLFSYWGANAGIASSAWIAKAAERIMARHHPDMTLVYLPHLDYDLQRYGPSAPQAVAAARELDETIAPLLATGATVVLAGVIAGLMGGTNRARLLASGMWAVGAAALITGHLLSTATFDVMFTAGVTACLLKALTSGRPGWMLAAGAVLGAGLLNKLLIGIVVALVCAALLILGPRRPLLTWPALAGGGLAVLGAVPYLIWQSTHGWPQSRVAESIAGEGNRIGVLPIQLVLISIFLTPFLGAGLVRLLRRSAGPARAFGYAYLALVVLVLVTGGKGYYAAGLMPVIVASAGLVTDGWLARGRVRLRTALVGAAVGVSLVLNAINGLAITPVSRLQQSGINELNPEAGEQVGWPEFQAAVRAAVLTLPPDQRDRAVVFAANYAEAAAVGLGSGLPPAFSGHNGYAFWPPPASATGPVILTGFAPGRAASRHFTGCRVAGRVDNGYGLDNDEQGAILQVCDGPTGGWTEVWPSLIHYD